jgi:hypothetical protein
MVVYSGKENLYPAGNRRLKINRLPFLIFMMGPDEKNWLALIGVKPLSVWFSGIDRTFPRPGITIRSEAK